MIKKLIQIILSFQLMVSFASAQRLQSHVLELQNRIEAQIDRNLTNLISTQLAPATFDVSTRVKVVEIPPANKPPKNDKKKDPSEMPAGMDLGAVDVREVIEAYKSEIEELKAFKESNKQELINEPKFSVNRIEVVVGLSDQYDDAYVAQFNEWLSKRVNQDYGALATATVNKAKPLPVKDAPGPNWRDFLPFISYGLLAIALMVAAWLLSRGLIRLGEGTKSIVLEHKNPFALEHNQKVENKIEEKTEQEKKGELEALSQLAHKDDLDNENELLQAGDELIGKITYLCLELGKGVNDIVRLWLDNGNDGFIKTAVLVDMIVTLKEKVSSETAAANNLEHKKSYPPEAQSAIMKLTLPLDQDLVSSYGVNLSEAYREAASMDHKSKFKFLEQIYWDLLQARSIGVQNMRKPFDYLDQMSEDTLGEVLKSQTDEGKALALMFGDSSKTQQYLATLDEEEKQKIVQKMLNLSKVSQKQLWDMDSSLKLQLINSSLNPSEKLINLFPRTIDLLNSLDAYDEMNLLRGIVANMPDRGLTIKQQYTTLAFVDEWNAEFVAKLIKVATSNELVNLLRAVPEAKEFVLGLCPEKMKMLVSDDLELQSGDEKSLKQNLRSLKSKWKNICSAENIAMGRVINLEASQSSGGVKYAA